MYRHFFIFSVSRFSQINPIFRKDEQDGGLYLYVSGTFFVMVLLMNCAALALRQKPCYGENEQVTYLQLYRCQQRSECRL